MCDSKPEISKDFLASLHGSSRMGGLDRRNVMFMQISGFSQGKPMVFTSP